MQHHAKPHKHTHKPSSPLTSTYTADSHNSTQKQTRDRKNEPAHSKQCRHGRSDARHLASRISWALNTRGNASIQWGFLLANEKVSLVQQGKKRSKSPSLGNRSYRIECHTSKYQNSLEVVIPQSRLLVKLGVGEDCGAVDNGRKSREASGDER